ncbi:hypothetical protein ACE1AT_23765 [Pelatocladus sp. BLCC-F211]|uniref:hypothetical protein n=1 Tax=Pelatocladus sp. BLCC-F211 TaxID=3342752 RepID=UPI0035B6C740
MMAQTPPPTKPVQPQPNQEVEQTPEETTTEEQLQEEQTQENLSPEEAQQVDTDADSELPKPEQNPFNKPSIDAIIQKEFNEDMWRILKGGLPCLETSATCLQQLQDRAIAQSPLLKEIDTRITEANDRIDEAKSRNQRSIKLSILTPALQYLLGPETQPGQKQSPGMGLIDNIAAVLRGDVGIINGLLRVIGIPLFQGVQGGNDQAQARAIAISDLQVKIAELQRSKLLRS